MKPVMNRPVRIRMRGGVGSGREKLPLTRLYFQIASNHSYEWNKDNVRALEVLEQQYQQKRARRKSFTSLISLAEVFFTCESKTKTNNCGR